MLTTTYTTVSNRFRLPFVSLVALLLTACDPDGPTLLDLDLDSLQDVVVQTAPEEETSSNPDTNGSNAIPDSNTPVNISSPSAPVELSANQIPIELALLTEGEIVTESRFGSTGDPIVDRFTLPASSFELTPDGNLGALRYESGNTVTVCSYVFQAAQYLCLRAFDLDINDRVWHLFSMQSNTNGSGVFEFCTVENSEDDCLDKLLENPDGTATITINRASAIAELTDASPYFAYENQATLPTRSTDVGLSGHYSDAMTQILKWVK